jgi:hypothetical protein
VASPNLRARSAASASVAVTRQMIGFGGTARLPPDLESGGARLASARLGRLSRPVCGCVAYDIIFQRKIEASRAITYDASSAAF